MTDKQCSALLTAVVGAALFIGGAVLSGRSDYGTLLMIFGAGLMAKDTLIPFLTGFASSYRSNDIEKEDKKNDSN